MEISVDQPLLQKLEGEWIQAYPKISRIVWEDKRYLWLVDGIQGNHQPKITNAPPTEQSQISLRRKLVPNPLIVYGMDYGSNHEM